MLVEATYDYNTVPTFYTEHWTQQLGGAEKQPNKYQLSSIKCQEIVKYALNVFYYFMDLKKKSVVAWNNTRWSTLLLPSALQRVLSSLSLLFWFSGRIFDCYPTVSSQGSWHRFVWKAVFSGGASSSSGGIAPCSWWRPNTELQIVKLDLNLSCTN